MMKGSLCGVHKIAGLLLLVGGINWGLVAIDPAWNLVDMAFGMGSMAARVVYGLVGLSALFMLTCGKCCMKGGCCGTCNSCKGMCGSGCQGGQCNGKTEGKGCEGGKCNGSMNK